MEMSSCGSTPNVRPMSAACLITPSVYLQINFKLSTYDLYCKAKVAEIPQAETLHAAHSHGTVAQCNYNNERDDAAWHTSADEMLDLQVPLTSRIFLHNCR